MKKFEETILDLWLKGKTLSEIALETGKTIAQIASIIQKVNNALHQLTSEDDPTKSSSKKASLNTLEQPKYNSTRIEEILETSGPLSSEEEAELHKAIDYWEHINEISDEKWDRDVLENITEELMRIGRRLEQSRQSAKKSDNKVIVKIRQAQALIRDLQDPSEDSNNTNAVKQPILDLLQKSLTAEFQQWDLYYAYKSQLRGMARDPVSDHFGDHAEEEASHIETLQRYIVGYGEQPTTNREPIPSLGPNPTMEEIVKLQLHFEQKAVDTYKLLLEQLGETDPLRIEIENILAQEQEHVHDLQLLLV